MRLLVARCAVRYTGRLNAVLPEAVRLLILKADGSVLVHDDAGGFKPLNWMTAPTSVEDAGDTLIVRKPKTDDALEIKLVEILSDVTHDMGESAALQKDGVERDLQEELAAAPTALGEELTLVKREWATDVGPVDSCAAMRTARGRRRDQAHRDDRGGRAVDALSRLHPRGSREERMSRHPGGAEAEAAGDRARGLARHPVRRGRPRVLRGEREPDLTLFAA